MEVLPPEVLGEQLNLTNREAILGVFEIQDIYS